MPQRPNLSDRPRPETTGPSALSGLRVVDFTRVVAGPFATQLLGDYGAEIIKIEQTGTGDDTRHLIPQPSFAGESFFYLAMNRNKKSVALDLSTQGGVDAALALIATADVVVENFTSRVMRRFGLDYASLRDRFPRLIYCSISAYGREGRLANAAGYDSAISMESGVASLNAMPGEPPVPGGVPFIDLTTALNATVGILMALRAREVHGRGQFVECALYDSAIADLCYKGYQYLACGQNPEPMGMKPKFGAPGGQFACTDGMIWFTCTSQKMFHGLCARVLDRPDLLDDPRFATQEFRNQNAAPLYALVSEAFAGETRSFWSDRLKGAGLPSGEMRLVGEALMSRETAERELIFEIEHPTAGPVPMIAPPIRMSLTPALLPTAPPRLGEHTAEILRELPGYDATTIAALADQGAVQVHAGES